MGGHRKAQGSGMHKKLAAGGEPGQQSAALKARSEPSAEGLSIKVRRHKPWAGRDACAASRAAWRA